MSNQNSGELRGEWLRIAVKAQGETFRSTALRLGTRPDKYTHHAKDRHYLKAESLAELAKLYPSMNMRYVLTGEGEPVLK